MTGEGQSDDFKGCCRGRLGVVVDSGWGWRGVVVDGKVEVVCCPVMDQLEENLFYSRV